MSIGAGGFGGGMSAGGWYGLAAQGIADFTNEQMKTYLRGKQAQVSIVSLESQDRILEEANKANLGYINEELAQNLWNLYDQAKSFEGEQIASAALSGFTDISTGDRRLISSTRYLTNKAAEGLNRSAFLKAFEMQKQTDLKRAAIRGEIAQQKIIKKYNSGLRGAFQAANTSFLNFMAGTGGEAVFETLAKKGQGTKIASNV